MTAPERSALEKIAAPVKLKTSPKCAGIEPTVDNLIAELNRRIAIAQKALDASASDAMSADETPKPEMAFSGGGRGDP